ncbi:MAG: IS21 family transposase [Alphaproteobacteria bacterium]|nr:IS21 family transposase [Alphaproteobacteria bacterium]MBU6472851.1 IS21 family transposase [Alphaproteobacteria bacterium]
MRHIREVLRLHYSVGMSQRTVARSLGLAQGTVSKYLNRTRRAGLSWPLPPELDDDVRLENRLYPPPPDLPSEQRPQPDWAVVHSELRRPGVTLMLLWEEYCDSTANAFSYSWFCERYKEWADKLKPTLRQVHVAGEKLFVDYSGHTMEVIDRLTGEVHTAQIFVAVLGASNFTYAEASFTQSLPDWIGSHVRAFHFFGGTARQTVSDNLKAGVTRACFHEPMVNRTYSDLARHYRTAILPARPYRPRDKAKVEVGVQIVGRWILARLRNRRFFGLAELNAAMALLLEELNNRPMRQLGKSRRQLFEQIDRPALTPLPDEPYEYAQWKRCRVNLDYHVEIDKHYYSVPYNLVRQEVEARITQRTVEIFRRGKRVASHLRSLLPHRPTTVAEHMPSSHRRYRDWTHERIRGEAAKVGPDADTLIDVIMRSRPHPEQGFRSAIGILGLVKRYGAERVDAACARALLLGARSYKSVAAILKNGTDKSAASTPDAPILFHPNIRGRGYYN